MMRHWQIPVMWLGYVYSWGLRIWLTMDLDEATEFLEADTLDNDAERTLAADDRDR